MKRLMKLFIGRKRFPDRLPRKSSPFRLRGNLILLLCLSLIACWNPSLFADDALTRIKKSGVLKWGADAEGGAPYVFSDPDNLEKLTGFEWDLAAALAAEMGVRAEMVQNQWDGLVPALQRGNFDIVLNGLEITDEHRQQIAMSRPYYVYAQQIMVRKETTGVETLENLKGKAVGVLAASVAQRLT